MPIRAVVFDLDGTITEPYFDFDAIREEIGLEKNGEPILEAMEKMTPAQRDRAEHILHDHEQTYREYPVIDNLIMWGYDPGGLSLWDPISMWMGVEAALFKLADEPRLLRVSTLVFLKESQEAITIRPICDDSPK